MTLSKFEQDIRLELYNDGLTDNQVANILSINPHAMANWRHQRGLKANKDENRTVIDLSRTVSYKGALTPAQCEEMREFLICLEVLSKRQRGKVNVGEFIKEWRKRGGIGSD